MAEIHWTQSQRGAWSFVRSAVTRGLTATAGLGQYRAGGGSIRDAYWHDLFRTAFATEGHRESIKDVPLTYIVPATMSETLDVDWKRKYNYIAGIEFYNPETRHWETKYCQAQSDELLTKRDWRLQIEEILGKLPGSPAWDEPHGIRWIEEELWLRRRD